VQAAALTRELRKTDRKMGTIVMMSTRLCHEKMYLQEALQDG
jgi:hypothetical protein